MKLVLSLALAALAAVSSLALAQVAAPGGIPPPLTNTCVRPADHPGKLASDNQRKAWVKSVVAYFDCLKKYIADEQAITKPLIDATKPHIDATNKAIEDFNTATKEFKAQADASLD